MKFPVLTKSRVGFSIALVSVLTLVGVEVCQHVPFFYGRVMASCVAFGVLGIMIWLKGQLELFRPVPVKTGTEPGSGPELQDHTLAFLKSFRYWGFIIVTSAVLVGVLAPRPQPQVALARAPAPEPVEPPPPTNAPPPLIETNVPPAIVFPPLELSGLVYNNEKSTAVLNGRTLKVGDFIGEVKLVAVESNSVTVELAEARRIVLLEK